MSRKERDRLKVVSALAECRLKQGAAGRLLGLSVRQVRRLRRSSRHRRSRAEDREPQADLPLLVLEPVRANRDGYERSWDPTSERRPRLRSSSRLAVEGPPYLLERSRTNRELENLKPGLYGFHHPDLLYLFGTMRQILAALFSMHVLKCASGQSQFGQASPYYLPERGAETDSVECFFHQACHSL